VKSEIERYISHLVGVRLQSRHVKASECAPAHRKNWRKIDQREFHDAVLKSGALPLEILEEQVNEYIQRKKA